jgi:ribosomal protein S25
MREKRNNLVVVSKALHDKMMKEIPKKHKVITVYTLIENYRINGSIARFVIREMAEKGTIKPVAHSSAFQIYTKAGKE